MKISESGPIVGVATLTGLAEGWLLERYPQWSILLSAVTVVGGLFLSTRSGMLEKVGVGVASGGAALFGAGIPALVAPGATPGSRATVVGRKITTVARRITGGLGAGSESGVGARIPEFESVRVL